MHDLREEMEREATRANGEGLREGRGGGRGTLAVA
jgi:hypothetical protein